MRALGGSIIAEHGVAGTDDGVFTMQESVAFGSQGTIFRAASFSKTNPYTSVITGLGDISGGTVTLRIDGTQVAQSIVGQGTGNFLAHPLYFGARAGTFAFFNGYEDTSIIRFGPNLDADTISKVESYVASKTPEETI